MASSKSRTSFQHPAVVSSYPEYSYERSDHSHERSDAFRSRPRAQHGYKPHLSTHNRGPSRQATHAESRAISHHYPSDLEAPGSPGQSKVCSSARYNGCPYLSQFNRAPLRHDSYTTTAVVSPRYSSNLNVRGRQAQSNRSARGSHYSPYTRNPDPPTAATSTPRTCLWELRYRSTIREVFREVCHMEDKLQKLYEVLRALQPDDTEMDWEYTSPDVTHSWMTCDSRREM